MLGHVATVLGGLGLFLLGMSLLTDGLKVAAGPALRHLLERFTRSAGRGLLAGIIIAALVQSSSAVTVATVGFVNAGLLTLAQAIWVVFGANVGTTFTAWLVALVGLKLDMALLALPLLGLGMLVALFAARRERLAAGGRAVAGFGAFFLGIGILQQGFGNVADLVPDLPGNGIGAMLAFVGLGILLTLLTQSSSAAMALALTAASSGSIALLPAAAVVIGTNIGTTSTALFATIGATPAARRVAAAHIIFNLLTGVFAIALLAPLLSLAIWLDKTLFGSDAPATVLALFHTQFNLLGVLLIWPLAPRMIRWLDRQFRQGVPAAGTPRHLDPTLAAVPDLALRGLMLEVSHMMAMTFALARTRIAGDPEAMPGQGEAVLALGAEIRSFVARLTRQALPEASVTQLVDLLRATQHLEDIALAAGALKPDVDDQGLRDAANHCLVLRAAGEDARDQLVLARAAVERQYESTKKELLLASASGALDPMVMQPRLERAQVLRRIGITALKAQRRLLPWVPDGAFGPAAWVGALGDGGGT